MSPNSVRAVYQLLANEGLSQVYTPESVQKDLEGNCTPDAVQNFLENLGYTIVQKTHGTVDDLRTALHQGQQVLVYWLEWGGQCDLVSDVFGGDEAQELTIGFATGGGTATDRFAEMWQYNRGSIESPRLVPGLYLVCS